MWWSILAVVYVVSLITVLVFFVKANRKPVPVRDPAEDPERAFFAAQHEAQVAFEDPAMGPHSNEYFWRVLRALDRWEEWQGRPLKSLRHAGVDPSAVEWHALSLIESIPSDQVSQLVH